MIALILITAALASEPVKEKPQIYSVSFDLSELSNKDEVSRKLDQKMAEKLERIKQSGDELIAKLGYKKPKLP